MKKFLSLFLLILSVAIPVSANDLVAVLPLSTSSGISESEIQIITQFLEDSLINTGRIDLISQDKRDEIMSELTFSQGGCSDESCALDIGELLSAEYMVYGSVNRQETLYVLSIKKMNVETSKLEVSAMDTFLTLSPTQLKKTLTKVAYQLAGMDYKADDEEIASYTGGVNYKRKPCRSESRIQPDNRDLIISA